AGFLTTIVWVIWFKAEFYDLYEMLPGFAAGLLVTILVSIGTEPPRGASDEFDQVRRAVQGGT
ncbi:MAG: sodium:proline symporter, partial [Acidobacteriota bacterium]